MHARTGGRQTAALSETAMLLASIHDPDVLPENDASQEATDATSAL
jgi:hypothetical protein